VVTVRGVVALPTLMAFRFGLERMRFDRLQAAIALLPGDASISFIGT
jgi:hypothetical protein